MGGWRLERMEEVLVGGVKSDNIHSGTLKSKGYRMNMKPCSSVGGGGGQTHR